MSHTDGLSERHRQRIHAALARFPEVARVYIYGSRARGNFREHSDIDLAYESASGEPLSHEIHYQIVSLLDATLVPHKIDLVDRNAVRDPLFAAVLDRDCKLWWEHPSPAPKATETAKP